MRLQVVIPMAGKGKRFKDADYAFPKPLLKVGEKTMIECVIESVPTHNDLYLVVRKEMSDWLGTLKCVSDGNVKLIFSRDETCGAACTMILTRNYLDPNQPLLILDSDTIFTSEALSTYLTYCQLSSRVANVYTFPSVERHFSYVSLDGDGLVSRVKEKEQISNHAIAGAYWFASSKLFMDAALSLIIYGEKQKGEFYISGVLQELVSNGQLVGAFEGKLADFNCLGTPEAYERFIQTKY